MKNKQFILFLIILLLPCRLSAQITSLRLSPESSVTLLTCSPGDELYSVFGHSAIRVKDPLLDLDLVFNYGTFDFSDPNFYTNFVRGKLNYILSVTQYRYFESDYKLEERYIWEQRLNIDIREKQFLLDSLIINAQPENRYYLYDFFFDNCATRIRDIFVEGIDREIVFDYTALQPDKSFRELLMPYLREKPWAKLGINLALGLPSDEKATPWDYMFLPDHMMTVFENARFREGGEYENFTPGSRLILEGNNLPEARFRYAPLWVFILVLISALIMSYPRLQPAKPLLWYDRVLFGSAGLLGLLITFLWFFTDHHVTAWNLNILWAHPFHLAIVFFLSENRNYYLVKYYYTANLILLIGLILSWPFLPQALPWVVLPFVLAMAIRSAVIFRMVNNQTYGR